jgi:hypothetical protein
MAAERTLSGYGDSGAAKVAQTARELSIVDERLRSFAQKQAYRGPRALQWEESASLMAPQYKNTFYFGNYNFPGIKKTQLQVDSTCQLANWKFGAICDAMMTPFSSTWAVLASTDPNIQKDRQSRLYFERVSHILAEMRNAPNAAFRRNNQVIWQMLGAFGNGPLFVDREIDARGNPARGVRYSAIPLGQVYIETNHQGRVVGFDRWFRLTAFQASCAFEKIPEQLQTALEKNSQAPFDFLHCVCPNSEYEPGRKDAEAMPFRSYYISLTTKQLLTPKGAASNIGGYRTFPLPYARYLQNPEDPYADGPAQLILPALKTLNAEKTMYLKVGHRTADPILLGPDDGLVDPSLRPGTYMKGGMGPDGKPLVSPLEYGSIQITKEMMDEERAIIGEAFLTTIFSALVENPQMTATQVVELINQKGIFLAPMAGSVAPEYLGAMIEREVDLADDLMLLPPMPPLLREAGGQYKVIYTSPLFKAARAGDAAGFLRTVESALEVAGQTGDPSHMDPFAFKRAWPAIADIQSVPESWMASPDEMDALVQARAKAKQQEQDVQALPAQAAMLKAQAVVQKAGGRINQQPGGQPTA